MSTTGCRSAFGIWTAAATLLSATTGCGRSGTTAPAETPTAVVEANNAALAGADFKGAERFCTGSQIDLYEGAAEAEKASPTPPGQRPDHIEKVSEAITGDRATVTYDRVFHDGSVTHGIVATLVRKDGHWRISEENSPPQ